MIFKIETKYKVKNLANAYGIPWQSHMAETHRARKKIGILISNALACGKLIKGKKKLKVTLTKIGQKCDLDNLGYNLKHVRDAIAEQLGIDDGDSKRIEWFYKQINKPRASYGFLVIEIAD